MQRRVAQVLWGWLALTAGVAALTRVAVALPERCGEPDPAEVDTAIDESVTWFQSNQRADGTWLYRYQASKDKDLGGYNWVRHAGVMLSLYQAGRFGESDAVAVADRGIDPIVDGQLVRLEDRAALQDGGRLHAGGTALLLVALGERRLATGLTDHDDDLRALGRHLLTMVQPDGVVWNEAAMDGTPTPDTTSPFATGQVMFALARLHLLFPGEGWDEPANRIARYVVTERADREGYLPDTSDHWSAYGFSDMRRWPERAGGLDQDQLGFARKQLGLMSVQTRYETQRTNEGISRYLRGRQALGAAIGTIGEAMGQWSDVAAVEPALAAKRGSLRERFLCLSGAIVDRRYDAEEAAEFPRPSAVQGAHFQFGVTQMDDQQHTLSALLWTRLAQADPTPLPRRSPVPTNALLVALAAFVALNPVRLAAGAGGERRQRLRDVVIAGGVVVAVMGFLAAVGGPILRALDVSAGNAVIAAGMALVGGGIYCLVTPDEARPDGLLVPLVIPLGLRPDLMLLAAACGAGGRGWVFTAAVVAAVAVAGALAAGRAPRPVVHLWLMRLIGSLGLATAVALLVDGVYAI